MRAIVGIDDRGLYLPALQLLARFRFERSETTLAHFADPTPSFLPEELANSIKMRADYLNVVENAGRMALDAAKDEACKRDLHPKCSLRFGTASDGLSTLADEIRADLVAIRAEQGSQWSTSYLGSISRSLTLGCRASILVSKSPMQEVAPLTVVLATDHSELSRRWIDKFLRWRPRGISRIHIVSAYEVDDREAEVFHINMASLGSMADIWIKDHVTALNEQVVQQLNDAGYIATSHVVAGHANDVIRQAMHDTQADVLVMGAQGRGFTERVTIGSHSLHQVIAEPYPVLIVRI